MRKIREVLRLSWKLGLHGRATARACGVARSTVQNYLERAARAGFETWEAIEPCDEATLDRLLFPPAPSPDIVRPLPDWSDVHLELQKPGVTRHLVWLEYKEQHPEGLEYSRFCDLYRAFGVKLDLSLRQVHKAGERLFVDYCGQTIAVRDPATGEECSAQIFVAVMGASNYTYAEATWTQQLDDWLGSHERSFEFFGGVTEVVVPDNLRSGVSKACRYEPSINPSYQDLATHYGVAVVPARVRKPKDKAKVEAGVQVVERWILARLRHREFLSLRELNVAIRELLVALNERPFRRLSGTRRSRFEALDRPLLQPLPAQPYEHAEWLRARVGRDYHVEVQGHWYSVPHALVGQEVEVRLTEHGVECLHRGQRVACHRRSDQAEGVTTLREHMPEAHRAYIDWDPPKLLDWSEGIGESTQQTVTLLLTGGRHWRQGIQSAMGLRSLEKRFGAERLELACARAVQLGSPSYTSISSILKTGQDRVPLPESESRQPLPVPSLEDHHVRGADYYMTPTTQDQRAPRLDWDDIELEEGALPC